MLVERGLVESRSKAQALIMAGEVTVNGQRVDKAGTRLAEDVIVTVKEQPQFVSRGGEKLAWALETFAIDVANLVAADVGASTGGFTDCLLQNGIARVYAIDVGYGQLAHKLRVDERVVVIERTNARYIDSLDEPIDLCVIDASFISLRLILPQVAKWLKPVGQVVALIKPQFEAGKSQVGKGGVVKDQDVHEAILMDILTFSQETGFYVAGLTTSPIKGLKEGNTEFLVWLRTDAMSETVDVVKAVQAVLEDHTR
ncbi:TlyA family RNA methyltransferase [Candidatus Saccharibacteria bacterium]|nr:TlyA family RNA methyltransferase [Candidatus Saccharibacteria bacterium]